MSERDKASGSKTKDDDGDDSDPDGTDKVDTVRVYLPRDKSAEGKDLLLKYLQKMMVNDLRHGKGTDASSSSSSLLADRRKSRHKTSDAGKSATATTTTTTLMATSRGGSSLDDAVRTSRKKGPSTPLPSPAQPRRRGGGSTLASDVGRPTPPPHASVQTHQQQVQPTVQTQLTLSAPSSSSFPMTMPTAAMAAPPAPHQWAVVSSPEPSSTTTPSFYSQIPLELRNESLAVIKGVATKRLSILSRAGLRTIGDILSLDYAGLTERKRWTSNVNLNQLFQDASTWVRERMTMAAADSTSSLVPPPAAVASAPTAVMPTRPTPPTPATAAAASVTEWTRHAWFRQVLNCYLPGGGSNMLRCTVLQLVIRPFQGPSFCVQVDVAGGQKYAYVSPQLIASQYGLTLPTWRTPTEPAPSDHEAAPLTVLESELTTLVLAKRLLGGS